MNASLRFAFVALGALATGCASRSVVDAGVEAAVDVVATADAAVVVDVVRGCAAFANCAACTGAPGCGWCFAASACMPGDSQGPADGGCMDWDFIGARCDTDAGSGCAAHATCGACTDDIACGWCSASQQCVAGDDRGATNGSCSATDWLYTMDQCPRADAGADATADASADAAGDGDMTQDGGGGDA
jgi:hypothetical protein